MSTQTVRQYEVLGFLPAVSRSPKGHRQYEARHLRAMEAARAMQAGYGWMLALQIMRHLHAGAISLALELVDFRHAELHAGRQEIEETRGALRVALEQSGGVELGPPTKMRGAVRVAAAARMIGAQPSTLRFWEEAGLLHPTRDPYSRYRLYDRTQIRNLHVVSILRQANFSLEEIAAALAELGTGSPECALMAIDQHRADLIECSRRCAAATAAFWDYLSYSEAEGRWVTSPRDIISNDIDASTA